MGSKGSGKTDVLLCDLFSPVMCLNNNPSSYDKQLFNYLLLSQKLLQIEFVDMMQ